MQERTREENFAMGPDRSEEGTVYSALWEPSHSGAFFVCLQPHIQTVCVAPAVYSSGTKALPLWLPSQKG